MHYLSTARVSHYELVGYRLMRVSDANDNKQLQKLLTGASRLLETEIVSIKDIQ